MSTTGRVFLWDANERKATRIARVGFQAICVAISHGTLSSSAKGRSHHHIVVGGRRGNLAALEESTFLRVLSEKPCKSAISDIKFSLDDRHLAVASHDCCIDLYGTPARKNGGGKYQWLRRLVGHSSTVNHVDFSRDSLLLMSASADYDLLYWNVRTGKQVTEAQRDVDWLTWTSRIGFAVMGIWPEFSDGTDINSVDRSNSKEVVATADDFGGVKIFNWPCVVANAGFRKYKGHSSHVTCARFSHSDNWLFTCGSRDRAVFQFRCAYPTYQPIHDGLSHLALHLCSSFSPFLWLVALVNGAGTKRSSRPRRHRRGRRFGEQSTSPTKCTGGKKWRVALNSGVYRQLMGKEEAYAIEHSLATVLERSAVSVLLLLWLCAISRSLALNHMCIYL